MNSRSDAHSPGALRTTTAAVLSLVVIPAWVAACGDGQAATSSPCSSVVTPTTPDAGALPDAAGAQSEDAGAQASDAGSARLTRAWGKAFGPGIDASRLAGAPNGDLVSAGLLSSPVDFGGGALNGTVYVARFAADGSHLWAKIYGATDARELFDVAVDPKGDIVFAGDAHRAGGSYVAAPCSDPSFSASGASYVAKVKGDGSGCAWGHSFQGNFSPDQVHVALDASANVIVAVNGQPTGIDRNASTGGPFLKKYGPDGTEQWSKDLAIGALAGPVIYRVATDPTGAVYYLAAGNRTGIGGLILGKYDGAGSPLWEKTFATTFALPGSAFNSPAWGALTVDSSGNAYLAGHFQNDIDLGSGVIHGAQGLSHQSLLLASFSADGALRWSKSFAEAISDSGNQYSPHVDLSLAGDEVLLTGSFWRTMDFGGGPLVVPGTSDADTQVFAAAYDGASGAPRWQKALGASTRLVEDGAWATKGKLWIQGEFHGTADVDGLTLTTGADAQAGGSLFLAQFSEE
jgi:hypothetical protein